jgi:hypothetical protein
MASQNGNVLEQAQAFGAPQDLRERVQLALLDVPAKLGSIL